MRTAARLGLITLALLLVALVPSAVITILLLPLWSWVEKRFQIESVGHSGPADWCYLATYVALVAIFALAGYASVRAVRPRPTPPPR